MENYVTEKLIGIHKQCEDLIASKKSATEALAEYGWKLIVETTISTFFVKYIDGHDGEEPHLARIAFQDGDWKLKTKCYLENGELLAFSDYIDIRKMIDDM